MYSSRQSDWDKAASQIACGLSIPAILGALSKLASAIWVTPAILDALSNSVSAVATQPSRYAESKQYQQISSVTMISQSQPPIWITVLRLLRWDKPTGRLILMIPALWAVFLAGRGTPPALLVGVIILGSLATSAGGCVVNDLWDRNIDPKVKRTRNRPLASRALSVRVGLGVAAIAFLCAYGLSLFLTPLSFGLCVAAVPVIVLYPLAKRVFPVPQLVLAIAWGFAVLISWSAVTGSLEPATWLLWAATVLWTLGFDTVYAIPDREYDRQLAVNSSALFFGNRTPLAIGIFFATTAMMLVGLGVKMGLTSAYWLTLAIAVALWSRQVRQLTRRNPPGTLYGRIFRENVYLGFGLLAGMIVGSLV